MNILSKSEFNIIVDTTKFRCNVNGDRGLGGKGAWRKRKKVFSEVRAYLNINNLTPGNR